MAGVLAVGLGHVGDTSEDIGEPGLRVDVVELGGGDHRQHEGATIGATLRAGEGPRASTEGDAA